MQLEWFDKLGVCFAIAACMFVLAHAALKR
jgi:hypothetical protein